MTKRIHSATMHTVVLMSNAMRGFLVTKLRDYGFSNEVASLQERGVAAKCRTAWKMEQRHDGPRPWRGWAAQFKGTWKGKRDVFPIVLEWEKALATAQS